LLLESSLAVLQAPSKRTFDTVKFAFTRYNEKEKRWDPILGGHSADIYNVKRDLVLLKQPQYEDRFTAFVHKYFSVLFTV
jgi:hypothetical protein